MLRPTGPLPGSRPGAEPGSSANIVSRLTGAAIITVRRTGM